MNKGNGKGCDRNTFAKWIKENNVGKMSKKIALVRLLLDLPNLGKLKEAMELLKAVRGNILAGLTQNASDFFRRSRNGRRRSRFWIMPTGGNRWKVWMHLRRSTQLTFTSFSDARAKQRFEEDRML